ncbi:MAG: transglutaminase domain-containing protein [Candidatus Saganbacteria bacterium]|nr:transglutaminase domain-containing protein [Candidatus Saganbacteria bacterium]
MRRQLYRFSLFLMLIVTAQLFGCVQPKLSEPPNQRRQIFQEIYPYTAEQARAILAKEFPAVPAEQREQWLKGRNIANAKIDGQKRYFSEMVKNIKFRNIPLFQKDSNAMARYRQMYQVIKPYIYSKFKLPAWQNYRNPRTYHGTTIVDIPRRELPKKGLFRLWLPLPVLTAAQTDVRIISIAPAKYIRSDPTIDRDIGLVYMEIPLEELKGNLKARLEFSFKRLEQRFQVDPARVGEYDRESELYKRYTRSYGNTRITPAIRGLAKEIVGREKNPYLAARLIYDHVVQKIKYSFMPHDVLWPRGQPESVFVHEHGWGDCGAQSLYFSALCRAVGIPARTTGGFQLLRGEFGSHFWAEFYLPGYGWVPVDTSVAQLPYYLPELTARQKQDYIDFFFAGLDNRRCVLQKDIDVPLIPPADGLVSLPMAIQFPAALCEGMERVPGSVVYEHAKMYLR